MQFALDFRREFVDAYLAGKVSSVGLHSTHGPTHIHALRRGLKCTPHIHRTTRRELGVHWYLVMPLENTPDMSPREVGMSFDDLCRCFRFDDDTASDLPGVVVLEEKVPHSRFYDGREPEGNIFNQKYVPVIPKQEKSIHTLVYPASILDIFYLAPQEARSVVREANARYGTRAKIAYFKETKRYSGRKAESLEDQRTFFIHASTGRMLLSKTKNYLIAR